MKEIYRISLSKEVIIVILRHVLKRKYIRKITFQRYAYYTCNVNNVKTSNTWTFIKILFRLTSIE